MAIVVRQEINILNGVYTGTGTVNGNELVQLDTTQYVNPLYYFEAVFSGAASNTGNVRLTRKGTTTDDATITGSVSGTAARGRSTSFSPPAGQTEYFVRIVGDGVRSQTVKAGRIIIIDSPTGGLYTTETQIEIGNNEAAKTNTAAAALSSPKYWLYTSANWDGTVSFFAEVVYKTSAANTTTITLQEDDGSFGTWADKVTIVNAVSNTTVTRARSAAFTPTTGRHYRISAKCSTTKSSYTIYAAKIIVDSIGTTMQGSGGSTDLNLGASSENAYANCFTGDGNALKNVQFFLKKTGSPTGNATVKIYAETHATAFGTDSIPTGAALATSTTNLDVSTLTTSYQWLNFAFDGTFTPVNGTHYCVSIEYSAGSTGNVVNVKLDSTTNSKNYSDFFSGAWASDGPGGPISFRVFTTGVTKIEAQHLLLNTKSTSTGLQIFQTLYSTAEWSADSGTITYKHAQDGIGAGANAKLQDIDNSNTDVTNSSVTGANQQISSALTMPTTGHQIDTNIVAAGTEVDASRLLVIFAWVATVATTPIGKDISNLQNTLGAVVQQAQNRSNTY